MAVQIGVDVGGTFTDLVLYDERSGQTRVVKGSTVPHAVGEGVAEAVGRAAPAAGELDAETLFLHGTTVGLNSLLERNGATVGLLATRGFRDVLELRRGDRRRQYDILERPPRPLVPRHLRLAVGERMRADGSVEHALGRADVIDAVAALSAAGAQSLAIAFINAYANPRHELEAAQIARAAGFAGTISLSHEVSGEYREYERTSTTVVDAYVRPRVAEYIDDLSERLTRLGVGERRFVTNSAGGAMTFQEARRRPFETIQSGPAAGAVGAAMLCASLGIDVAITADVGGTSFDTCLVERGRPRLTFEGAVADMVIQAPWIDVRSIGAGGGSIAHVDAGGLLRVGPLSAGARPGPASYARGGTAPTVTDAALILGMLGEGELADGLTLRRDLALAAIAPLAATLAMEPAEAARGVLTIATSRMADAIREVLAEQGVDPREAALIAFGGAGPLFSTMLAAELEIRRLVIPPYAGAFSAWGLLQQDLLQSAARTTVARLDAPGLATADAVLGDLFATLSQRPSVNAGTVREAALDMRYAGQDYTLSVAVPLRDGAIAEDGDLLAGRFATEYERTFGHTIDEDVEIVAVRASVRTALPRRPGSMPGLAAAGAGAGRARTLDAFSFSRGRWLPFPVVDRASLAAGAALAGPAIVREEAATTYLDAGYELRVDASGAILVAPDGR